MDISNKKAYAALSLIIFFVCITNLISFKNGHNWGDDFAEYISFGKSIVDGTLDELMSMCKYRVENSTVPTGTVNTYWGLPLLLSPVYYAFGTDIHIFKIYVSLFFLLSLIIVFLLFQDRLKNLQNLLLVAIMGFNPFFFDFKDNIVSDIPYLFFSLFSLFFIKRFVLLRKVWFNWPASYFLLGLLIFISSLIRPLGIILLPTLFIVQYLTSKSVKLFIISDKLKFTPYIVFIVLTVISGLVLPSESISGDSERTFNYNISNLIFNIKYHAIAPASFFPYFDVKFNAFGLGYDKIHLVLYAIILLIVAFGVVRNIKEDYLFILYAALNLTVFVLVTGRDQRFFMPLFPFFIYFLFLGLSRITVSFSLSDKFSLAPVSAVYLLGTGLLVISLLSISHSTYKNIIFNKTEVIEGPYSPDSTELFNYIKEHTKKDDAIIFNKPRAMVLYTGRKSFAMGSQNFTPEKAFNSDAQYIVINKTKYLSSDLTLQDFQGKLDCEFENGSFLLCDLKKNLNR